MRRYFEYGRRILKERREAQATEQEIASQYPQVDDPSINEIPEPDDMQHVGELAEEINLVDDASPHAKSVGPCTEDDMIIDLIEGLLF